MRLNVLKMHNFMPYKGETEIAFPQNEQMNVVVVFGDNMRGKTSILNALRWAFYGEVLDRQAQEIPLQKIVNSDAALEDNWRMEVHLKFEANGSSHDLRRVSDRRKHISSPRSPKDFTQTVHLSRDGIVISADQIEEVIELILPKQISRFFLFDGELLQEYETLLIEESEQGRQIKDAIEQILGVPTLTNGRIDLQTILKRAQKRLTADIKQVSGLKMQAKRQAEMIEKIDSINSDLADLKRRSDKLDVECKKLNEELRAAESVVASAARMKSHQEHRSYLLKECEKKEIEILELRSDAWKDLINAQIQIRRSQMEREQDKMLSSIGERYSLKKNIEEMKKILEMNECRTCTQPIHDEHRIRISEELGRAKAELETLKDNSDELQNISTRLGTLSKIRSINAAERLRQANKDLQNHQVKLTEIENEIEKLKDEIAEHDTVEIARKRKHYEIKIGEIAKLKSDIQSQVEERSKFEDELAMSQRAIAGLTKDRAQRSTIKVNLCSELEKVFTHSIDNYRNLLRLEVETLANKSFKCMTTQKNYYGLEINDNYGLQIIDSNKHHVAVRSAGAEQVVALSLIVGLNRTARSTGPIIMDTPFGRLDTKHRNNILSHLPSVASQLILLVHSGEMNKATDLDVIADRIGAVYEIIEVSSAQSRIERTKL